MTATRRQWTAVINPRIRVRVEQFSDQPGHAARNYFEEHAGMLEYESSMERATADELALQRTRLTFLPLSVAPIPVYPT